MVQEELVLRAAALVAVDEALDEPEEEKEDDAGRVRRERIQRERERK